MESILGSIWFDCDSYGIDKIKYTYIQYIVISIERCVLCEPSDPLKLLQHIFA